MSTTWPPPSLAPVLERTAEAQVWWEGDTAKLDAYYQRSSQNSPAGPGGRVRKAWHAFWGRPTTNAQQPIKRLHVPIAGDITKLSASSLFAEPPTIVATEADAAVQDRIDLLFNTPTFHSALFSAAESASALGGVYARVVWDPALGEAWIDFVDSDRALPEWRWGRLSAVTFWTELDADNDARIVYRHLERHEPGQIVHTLHQGTRSELGRLVPLTDHPATADLPVNAESAIPTGLDDALTAAYIPNVAPNPEWRHDPVLRHLGRADISPDVIPLMDQLDEIYSSLMRDFRIGKARMFASDSVLTTMGPGGGVLLPEDQEVFTRVGSGFGSDGGMQSLFEFHQPSIRITEHSTGADLLVREILRRTGYSPLSFGMADEVAQTATEATGKARLTLITTLGKSRHWTAALAPLITTCLKVDAALFKGIAPVEDVEIEWPPFARESDLAKAQTVQAWSAAGAASTRTMVDYLHADWDEARVEEEVAEIAGAQVVPDPFAGLPADQAAIPVDPNAGPPAALDQQPADTSNAA